MSNDVNSKVTIKGIRIQKINSILMVLITALFVFVFIFSVKSNSYYSDESRMMRDYIAVREYEVDIRTVSNFLTEQVKSYLETGDQECIDQYQNEMTRTCKIEQTFDKIAALEIDEASKEELRVARDRRGELTNNEYKVFHLAAEAYGIDFQTLPVEIREAMLTPVEESMSHDEMIAYAKDLINGSQYENKKESMLDSVLSVIDSQARDMYILLSKDSGDLDNALLMERLSIALLCVLTFVLFAIVTILVSNPLKVYINRIENDSMIEMIGAYELKYLALTYNQYYEMNQTMSDIVKYSAQHDEMTGLLNRQMFDAITTVLGNHNVSIGLMVIRIDHYQKLMEKYSEGELKPMFLQLAEFLNQAVRTKDCVARLSDDEFGIIMMDLTKENVGVIDRKMNEVNALIQDSKNGYPEVTLSIGAALSENGYKEQLFKNANEALQQAIESGGNQCVISEEIVKQE